MRVARSNFLGTIHNIRKEAEKYVDGLPCMLQRFGCCEERSVQSHTLAASQLRLIAENGELQRLFVDPVSEVDRGSSKPGKIGVRAASAFSGFCQQHDKSLFVPIDEKDFAPSAENIRLLFFRAMAQEITKKAASVLLFKSFFWTDDELKSNGEAELAAVRISLGLRDNFFDFDKIWPLSDANENEIQYVCYDLKCAPFFASIGIINPEAFGIYFSNTTPYDGRIFRGVLFAAIPTTAGLRVMFAWFKGHSHLVKPLLERFKVAKTNLLEFSFQFCLEHCECTYFRPSVWASLNASTIKSIVELMNLNMDGQTYDILHRPLQNSGIDFGYDFIRIHTNSTWAKLYFGRSRVA